MQGSFYNNLVDLVRENDCQALRKTIENVSRENIIASLCKNDNNINETMQHDSITILHVASYYDSLESFLLIEDILKSKGMDEHQILSTLSAGSYYPLHYALINGSFEVSEYILERIPQQAREASGNNMSSIELAVISKEPELLEDVLEAIGDLTSNNIKVHISKAIERATRANAYSCLEILIDQDTSTRQSQGQASRIDNILIKAVRSRLPEVISLIMKRHTDELTQTFPFQMGDNTIYISFLSEIFKSSRDTPSLKPVIMEALKILNDQNIDISNPSTKGAVHWICIAGDIDIARYVLYNFKVDVNKLDEKGETGAHCLFDQSCDDDNIVEFIKLLKEKGYNANNVLMQDGSIKAPTLLQKCVSTVLMRKELLKTTEFLLSKACNCNPDALWYYSNKANSKVTIREYVNKYRSKAMKDLFARIPIQTQ